jgi:hypothetical protein
MREVRSHVRGHAFLMPSQIQEIRLALLNGLNGKRGIQARLAEKYDVTQQTICDIKHLRSWKHLGRMNA